MKYTLPAAIIISAIIFSYAYMNRQTNYQYCVEDLKKNNPDFSNLIVIEDDKKDLDLIHTVCLGGYGSQP